ncbi:sorting nexin-10A [Parasteatoda tepidariorum]|uniref:sorting nexin-10A n=1 Tax=Parasteatoda tepidariorum TaxID=114398 RepID=UPI00077F854B|nr:sorting nexin-10A [Parasteatoda tepidariorum]
MDNKTMITVVSVHSPLIQFSSSGSYYTSYAISLKSNDPCFSQSYSQVRRRYSEFQHLRRLLESHFPTMKAPVLPPKSFFNRFSDAFIDERKKGLQIFLDKVLSTLVYLSDKSLHLFLQSTCSMNQIDEECIGDIPAPQLMDIKSDFSDQSDTSSSQSSCPLEVCPVVVVSSEDEDAPATVNVEISKGRPISTTQTKSRTISTSLNFNSKPLTIPRRLGSLDSSPASSLSSLDTSYSPTYDNKRKVSFNQNVTVAVVYNQLWNIGTRPIRTDA